MIKRQNLQVLKNLIHREVTGRFRGSLFGVGWALFTPLLTLSVFTLMFGSVFGVRWGQAAAEQSVAFFALVLFCGLTVFNFFAEVLSRSPNAILSNANFVKKIVFPIEILPVVITGSALVQLGVSFAVLLIFTLFITGGLSPWVLLAPLAIAPLALMVQGIGWILASLGVYFRDISQMVGPILTAVMFLSPIFVPRASMPAWLQPWLALNPLTIPVESLRSAVLMGSPPDWLALGVYSAVAVAVALAGRLFFETTRRGFADVL